MTQQTADRMLSEAEMVAIQHGYNMTVQGYRETDLSLPNSQRTIGKLLSHIRAMTLTAAPAGDVGELCKRLQDTARRNAARTNHKLDADANLAELSGEKFVAPVHVEACDMDEWQAAALLSRLSAPPPASPEVVARVERSSAGTSLYVYGVPTRGWFGTFSNEEADELAAQINLRAMGGKA